MKNSILVTVSTCTLLALSACNQSTTEQTSSEATESVSNAANSWLLTSAPEGAISITDAKASAKEGDTVVIKGRIGGRHSPISDESAVFTVVDLELSYCGQHSDDGCPTPWDYCCETPETLGSNSATVQVVGDGIMNPAEAGLEPLDEVVFIGTVGPRPDDQVLIIRATGVFRSDG